jgi:hypothetical protein
MKVPPSVRSRPAQQSVPLSNGDDVLHHSDKDLTLQPISANDPCTTRKRNAAIDMAA